MSSSIRRMAAPGIALVLLTVVISGVSNFVNVFAVKDVNIASDGFVAVRNVFVAAMLVPFAFLLARRDGRHLGWKDWLRLAAIGLLGGAIPFLLFFRGLQLAPAAGGTATASFGYRTLFVMAAVLGVVALKERFSARLALGAGLLLAGNALLLSLGAPIWTDGTAYVLLATALWAGEYTLSKRTLRDLGSSTVALGRMGFGGIFLVGYVGLTGQFAAVAGFGPVQWEWAILSAVLLLGFVVTWYSGLKTVDLSVATALLVAAFPVTSLLAAVAGAGLTVSQAAGIVVIALGIVVAVGLASLRDSLRDAWRIALGRLRVWLVGEARR